MSARIMVGDCRETMRALPAESMHCVVTSPPYFGLRDYGAAGQIGLESTVAEYLARMRDVFTEVHRVLRRDGTLWLNLGDCYNAGTSAPRKPSSSAGGDGYGKHGYWTNAQITHRVDCPELKPKDLLGIPWRVAFMLQDAGWYLRAEIIWHKPNPMPESITDRPTRAHETVFLLSKSPRYFYDGDAVREPAISDANGNTERKHADGAEGQRRADHLGKCFPWANDGTGRNRRTVWTITTEPYHGAHFATFPRKLVEPCILAGTSARGCCPTCGAPWRRVVEVGGRSTSDLLAERGASGYADAYGHYGRPKQALNYRGRHEETVRPRVTTGWEPGCACAAGDPVPCRVLDPFAGSGTVGEVTLNNGRSAVLCEINPDYAQLIRDRLGLFARVA